MFLWFFVNMHYINIKKKIILSNIINRFLIWAPSTWLLVDRPFVPSIISSFLNLEDIWKTMSYHMSLKNMIYKTIHGKSSPIIYTKVK
jgi:hypothetical protein